MHASGCRPPSTFTAPSRPSPKVSDAAVVKCCPCGRRHLFGSAAAGLLTVLPSRAAVGFSSDQRPDWYEEFYAKAMDEGMKSYEAEIAGYKSQLFNCVREVSENVLELGVGTGPNFKYYARHAGMNVFGVDPNKKMEKYSRAAANASGLPSENFRFMLGVGEALPVTDDSMDAVIGTLVLCSVRDVDTTLKEVKRVLKPGGLYFFIEHVAAPDGSLLRFVQGALDPLQQVVSDGCHLTRDTGKLISEAGFSSLKLNMAVLSTVSLISPHVYGVACN